MLRFGGDRSCDRCNAPLSTTADLFDRWVGVGCIVKEFLWGWKGSAWGCSCEDEGESEDRLLTWFGGCRLDRDRSLEEAMIKQGWDMELGGDEVLRKEAERKRYEAREDPRWKGYSTF